jgi:polyhydroxyalkanoate synthase subunit PhaC
MTTQTARTPRRADRGDLAAPSDDRVVDNVLGQQVMGDFRPSDLIGTAGSMAAGALRQPAGVLRASLGSVGELALLAAGESHLEPKPGDRRFTDPSWTDNPIFACLLQSYLALSNSLARFADTSSTDPRRSERNRFLFNQIGDAIAPSNFILSNPVALRKARDTRGLSLLRGGRNLLDDIRRRRPIPSQVDGSAFQVGGNLACSPGSVVLRTEMFELIQYRATTPKVRKTPILIVPSIVNKFYVFDLSPGRSIIDISSPTISPCSRWPGATRKNATTTGGWRIIKTRSTPPSMPPARSATSTSSTCGRSAAPDRSLSRWPAITPPPINGKSIRCCWWYLH